MTSSTHCVCKLKNFSSFFYSRTAPNFTIEIYNLHL
jgi:hypothetical protein